MSEPRDLIQKATDIMKRELERLERLETLDMYELGSLTDISKTLLAIDKHLKKVDGDPLTMTDEELSAKAAKILEEEARKKNAVN